MQSYKYSEPIEGLTMTVSSCINGAIQRDFDDFILASPIIKKFWRRTFILLLVAKNARILIKNDCERNLFYTVNE